MCFSISQALASCSCFQSFVQAAIEECEKSVVDEDLPLGIALDSLLEGKFLNNISFDTSTSEKSEHLSRMKIIEIIYILSLYVIWYIKLFNYVLSF